MAVSAATLFATSMLTIGSRPAAAQGETPPPRVSSAGSARRTRVWLGLLNAGASYDVTSFKPIDSGKPVGSVYMDGFVWVNYFDLGYSLRFQGRRQHGFYGGVGAALRFDEVGGTLGGKLFVGWQSRRSFFFELGVSPVRRISSISDTLFGNPYRHELEGGYTAVPLIRFGFRL
jgi:hypothetical protein